jgi:hypothetical protein
MREVQGVGDIPLVPTVVYVPGAYALNGVGSQALTTAAKYGLAGAAFGALWGQFAGLGGSVNLKPGPKAAMWGAIAVGGLMALVAGGVAASTND